MYTIRSRILPPRAVCNTLRTLRSKQTNTQTKNVHNNRLFHYSSSRYYGTSAGAEPFINGTSSSYVEEMYESWKVDPSSVHKVSNVYMDIHCKCQFSEDIVH